MHPALLDIDEGVRALRAGGVIAYPTEAVFGFGCDPSDDAAVARIVALKGRAADKGFILIASALHQLEHWLAPLEPAWRARLEEAWPGPVTFVVPAARDTPALVRGGRATIAVRVSAHPVVRALCDGCGHPLVSTSANASGEPALRDAEAVAAAFGVRTAAERGTPAAAAERRLDGIVAGRVGELRRATPIIDIRTGERLRA